MGSSTSAEDDEYLQGTRRPLIPIIYLKSFPVSDLLSRRPDLQKDFEANPASIILPPKTLQFLNEWDAEFPLSFKISKRSRNRRGNPKSTHCGVSVFEAEVGRSYIPDRLMVDLNLSPGDSLALESTKLEQGTFALFQPQTVDFLEISDAKSVLEHTLRKFHCISIGDTIPIHYNNKLFDIKVLETRPNAAVCIRDVDLEVDFAPPVGYVETEAKPSCDKSDQDLIDTAQEFVAFTGKGQRLNDKPIKNPSVCIVPKLIRGIPDRDYEWGSISFLRSDRLKSPEKSMDIKPVEVFSGSGVRLGGANKIYGNPNKRVNLSHLLPPGNLVPKNNSRLHRLLNPNSIEEDASEQPPSKIMRLDSKSIDGDADEEVVIIDPDEDDIVIDPDEDDDDIIDSDEGDVNNDSDDTEEYLTDSNSDKESDED